MEKRNLQVIVHLVLLTFAIVAPRLVVVSLSAAPAKDAWRYWQSADLLSRYSFAEAIARMDSPPAYPLALFTVRKLHSAMMDPVDMESYWRMCQLVSVICHLAFVMLSYACLRRISPVGSFWACLILTLLPRQIRYSCDILADPLHGVFWMASFSLLLLAMRQESAITWGFAGIFAGLSTLTRFEGLTLLPLAATAFSIKMSRVGWKLSNLARSAAFPVMFAFIVLPYGIVRGGSAPKNTTRAMIGQPTEAEFGGEQESADLLRKMPAWLHGDRPAGAFLVLLAEYLQETRFVLGGLALVPIFYACIRWVRPSNEIVLAGAAALVFGCLLWVLRMRAGYLASRYFTPILPLVALAGVTGFTILWQKCQAMKTSYKRAGTVSLVLLLAISLAPDWYRPMHASRGYVLEAARWLKKNTNAESIVRDSTHLSAYLAGRRSAEPSESTEWFVAEDDSIRRAGPAVIAEFQQIEKQGSPAAEFGRRKSSDRPALRIFQAAKLELSARTREERNQ